VPKPTIVDCKRLRLNGISPFIVDVKSVSVLREVARKSGKSRKPSPDPNVKLLIVSDEKYPCNEYMLEAFRDDTAALKIVK
jgi:hypothetical protein